MEETSYAGSIDVPDFDRKMRTILKKIKNQQITIEEYVTIKIINFMDSEFDTYVTVLNDRARKEKTLPDLDDLLQSLKKEENRMKFTIIVAAMYSGREEYSGRGREDREGRGGFDRSSS